MTASGKQQTAKGGDSRSLRATHDPFAGVYTFRGLAVWQRAQELAASVYGLVRPLPNDRATSVVVQQLLRSSTSIAANIAEGHGRYSAGAYRNHLSIARGSTTETMSWIDLLKRTELITPAQEAELLETCAELMKMLSAKMIDLDRQTRPKRALREDAVEREV
ncbi:MAG: four helix bundle protein [Chloroflexota bacterium]|nr:four helix bundle protein [Chloroflexota bacterium]